MGAVGGFRREFGIVGIMKIVRGRDGLHYQERSRKIKCTASTSYACSRNKTDLARSRNLWVGSHAIWLARITLPLMAPEAELFFDVKLFCKDSSAYHCASRERVGQNSTMHPPSPCVRWLANLWQSTASKISIATLLRVELLSIENGTNRTSWIY